MTEVYRRINAEQAVLKRELTSKEKQEQIDLAVTQAVVSRWWHDKSIFTFELTAEELKGPTPEELKNKTLEEWQRLRFSGIPDETRSRIIKAIQRSRGSADKVTDAEIYEGFRQIVERDRQRLGIRNAPK